MSSLQQGLKELKIINFALKNGKVQLKNNATNRHKKHLFFQKASKGFASTLFTNQCNESVAISMVKFSSQEFRVFLMTIYNKNEDKTKQND